MQAGTALCRFKQAFVGDRAFYKGLVLLVLPIVAQQGITQFVNLLDNVMVGALGTESISGVAIVNQLIFVFNLTLFGGISGASIYTAQYAGVNDHEGVRHTLRFKLLLGAVVCAIGILAFSLLGTRLIGLYLAEEASDPAALELTLAEAQGYLRIALWGLAPFMVSQALGSTHRETGDTRLPMLASIVSLGVNLALNYLLIYGKLGFPQMGVRGAALATAIARYIEAGVLIAITLARRGRYPFINGLLKGFKIPARLVKKIAVTGVPLLVNELLWSTGSAMINQSYSVRGLQVVAATNITSTVWQVFAIIMFSMGSAISIMVGQKLGAGDIKGARLVNNRLVLTTLAAHIVIGGIVIATSSAIPNIYNVEPEVRQVTAQLLLVAGAVLPLHSLVHAAYFAIRSGGRTLITMLFDSVFMCVVALPVAFVLSNYTTLGIVFVYLCVQLTDAIKLAIALPILKSGAWAQNVIKERG